MPQAVDHDLEPLHVLEEQAAAEGLIPRTRRRRQDVPHDTDAELGVLGVMLWSTNAADTILELGLDPEHLPHLRPDHPLGPVQEGRGRSQASRGPSEGRHGPR